MIVPFSELVRVRAGTHGAVGAFTCYSVGHGHAVVEAAEANNDPVILLVAASSMRRRTGRTLVSTLVNILEASPVPGCVQLDHVSDLNVAESAIECGVGAVMVDGGGLTLAQNVDLSRLILAAGRNRGVEIEAEIGKIAGDEDRSTGARSRTMTNPSDAQQFLSEVPTACLAVSIGNVHGFTATPPKIDTTLLAEIDELISIPLALHGASGLSDAVVSDCLALGISKVNINTELRAAWFKAAASAVATHGEALSVLDALDELGEAVRTATASWLEKLRN